MGFGWENFAGCFLRMQQQEHRTRWLMHQLGADVVVEVAVGFLQERRFEEQHCVCFGVYLRDVRVCLGFSRWRLRDFLQKRGRSF